MENRLKLFQDIGLSEQKAKETAKNEKLANNLELIVNLVGQFYFLPRMDPSFPAVKQSPNHNKINGKICHSLLYTKEFIR